MVKIGIVEDDNTCYEQVMECIRRFEMENKVSFSTEWMKDGDELLRRQKQNFDILLLDIRMKFVDGMEAAAEIRKTDENVIIIFITTMAQLAIKGYEVGALDYLLKPLDYFAFQRSMRLALNKIEKTKKKYVQFKIKSGIHRMAVDDIHYIESLKHVLCIHTSKGSFEAYGTIKDYEETLEPFYFCRGNNGYLINLRYVKTIKGQVVTVADEELTLSRGRRDLFMGKLLNYWENE